MAVRIHLFYLLCLLPCVGLLAQPVPCTEDPPKMTSICADACIICDIDGFEGRHESSIPGSLPNSFCTFIVHNAQWIAFIAGSEQLTVRISVSNCIQNNGLEIGIYESLDCETFQLISNCEGGTTNTVNQGESADITVTEPLIIGQYYYLAMDGAFGDNCDWTLSVISGNTQVDPLITSGSISGPKRVCPGISTNYTTSGEVGATIFEWRLNGAILPSDEPSIDINWSNAGDYELCVTAKNACDEAPPTCYNIEVREIPDQLLTETICEGDTFTLPDTISLTEAGDYLFDFQTSLGCDSTMRIILDVEQAGFTDLVLNICEGDSIFIGETPYYSNGQYTELITGVQVCDSTVSLNLSVIICEIEGTVFETPTICFGESNGQLNFQIEDGTPPFSYSWERIGTLLTGSGNIQNLLENENITNLPIGTYLITIQDDFGNDLILIQEVSEPSPLMLTLETSDYNGFGVSCFAASDGEITPVLQGGVLPYQYQWSTGAQSEILSAIPAGTYQLTITDASACVIIAESTLTSPTSIAFSALFSDPDCEGLNSGSIEVRAISGGVAPYLFSINGSAFDPNTTFSGLSNGNYQLQAQDVNGCLLDTMANLTARIIPVIDLGPDQSIYLADIISLSLTANIPLDSVRWGAIPGLSCYDCPRPDAMPVQSSIYSVAVTSVDGCTSLDSIQLIVQERRRVYAPNAFSPNADGINDLFTLFGGPEVSEIQAIRIFSRWGELVYEDDTNQAWNGKQGEQPVATGVYLWTAEIRFIDDVVLTMAGDVLVVR